MSGSPARPGVRLFLDANIIVSGIAFSGPETDLLLLAEQGVYEALTSEYVMAQVERVLLGKLRLSEQLVRAAIAALPVRLVRGSGHDHDHDHNHDQSDDHNGHEHED